MNESNPLLQPAAVPAFDRIRPEHVVPAVRERLRGARAAVEAVIAAGPRTFAGTLLALDEATRPLEEAWTVVEHLRGVAHEDALAQAHAEVLPEVTSFFTGLALDPRVYAAAKEVAAAGEALAPDAARYLTKTLDRFRRAGAELAQAQKDRFQAIANELAELTTQFATNALSATAAWSLDVPEERLGGLPPSAVAMARAEAARAGVDGARFTLQGPSVTAVLTYLDDRGIREQVWRAYHARCDGDGFDNAVLLDRILRLRREQAALLGYADFADYVLEDRMAKRGAEAKAFLDRVEVAARPAFDRETAELAAFARDALGLAELRPWDVGWVSERLRKARFDLDEEALRPYFAFDRVLAGLFDLAHALYGVRITRADLPVWHPTVQSWSITDHDGTALGAFYTDFQPRPEKRQGAWMGPLRTGGPTGGGGFVPHLATICGTFTPPLDDGQALLTHREVETLFHEFGHLLHHLLSRVPIRGQAGTNVAWDFVELPSQLLENWCWERAALDRFALHVDTGLPLPDDLFQRMLAARTFRAGSFLVRQLGFGQTDLALHVHWQPERDGDALAWGSQRMATYAAVPVPDGLSILPTFLHLFGDAVGYAAGYYSYLWASVLEADAFARFQAEGLHARAVGQAFRDTVLARGDSDDPAVLFRAFLGRDPDPAAMLRRAGLAA